MIEKIRSVLRHLACATVLVETVPSSLVWSNEPFCVCVTSVNKIVFSCDKRESHYRTCSKQSQKDVFNVEES